MASRAGSGGAPRFLRYLTTEVMPLIDSAYRTMPGDRTLVGHSLGGTFGLFALLEAPALFRRLLIGSPSGWDGTWLARRDSALAPRRDTQPMAVYVSVGGMESLALLTSWRKSVDLLSAPKYHDVQLVSEILAGETHISAMPIATTRGLRAIFK